MFIAVHDDIKENIIDVSPDHWRIQAAILDTNGAKILIINSYFPIDPKTLRFNDEELLETFAAIDKILEENNFSEICWGGDLNADFLRRTGWPCSIS